MRVLQAWADLLAAVMEARTVELQEFARSFEEKRYYQGYADAIKDMHDIEEARNE